MTQSIHRRTGRLLACASAVVLAATTVGMAAAVPGTPGTPSSPEVLMHERFETGQTSGGLTKLADYSSAYGTFTADAEWLDATQGNGLIVDGTTPGATFDAAGFTGSTGQEALRDMATKLGQLNGTSPATSNHAVTAWTGSANPGANKVEFETVDPIDLNADGRFLTVAANVGVTSCHAAHPQLIFFIDDDGEETQVNPTALDPCQGNGAEDVYATELIGGRAALFTGDDVGIVIRNAQGSGGGNDHAFDDVRVLDVTPQLDKKFTDEGSKLASGDVTDLVLTVTNTSELAEKTGWSFVDHLPKGLKVAGDVTNNCDADVVAAEGSKTVDVSNGSLAQGQVSCDITVPVTSKKGGVFKNSAANIESVGLNKPGATSIRFLAPAGVKAPDTGEQRTAMWQFYAALLGGLALAGVGAQRLLIARRR